MGEGFLGAIGRNVSWLVGWVWSRSCESAPAENLLPLKRPLILNQDFTLGKIDDLSRPHARSKKSTYMTSTIGIYSTCM